MLIEVQVPALDGSYDFELDGRIMAEQFVGEIISLIEEKERVRCRDRTERYLYSFRLGCVLAPEEGLAAQGIQSGDELILV